MRRKLALREIKSLCLSTVSLFLFVFTIQSYQFQLVSHGHADILDCDIVRMESACNSGTSNPKLLHQLTGCNFIFDMSSIYMTALYEELRKSGKKLEKVRTIEKKSFI